MKKLFTFFLLVLTLNASAQSMKFTASNNSWQTRGTNGATVSSWWAYSGDTVVSSSTYQKLKASYLVGTIAGLEAYDMTFAVRISPLDSNMITIIDNTGTEVFLFRFNSKVNDTFVIAGALNVVKHLDSNLVDSQYYKLYTVHTYNSGDSTVHYYYDGMGNVENPVYPYCQLPHETMRCFGEGSFYPRINYPGIVTLTCTNEVHNVANDKTINIYPNPAITELTISAQDNITAISISNMMGQMVYATTCNTVKVEVNVAGLPAGVYFIKVNETEVRRFVKE